MRTLVSSLLAVFLLVAVPGETAAAKLKPETLRAWETYVQLTEKRVNSELGSTTGFLRADFLKPADAAPITGAIKAGQVFIQKVRTRGADGKEVPVPDGLIHHWFGAVFVPNVSLDAVLQLVKDYDQQQRYFKEVEKSKLLARNGDTFEVYYRFVRKKVVTVHYNTDHTVVYRRHQDGRESSRTFTTKIAEVQNPGTDSESEKPIGDDSGYLWRLNSFWRFKQQDGGVIIECESISLSRSIPFGLSWLIKGFVESVPQESLESTLTSIRDSLRK